MGATVNEEGVFLFFIGHQAVFGARDLNKIDRYGVIVPFTDFFRGPSGEARGNVVNDRVE